MSLEIANKVIVPQKKIMSRSFLNSGTLIVIIWPDSDPAKLDHPKQKPKEGWGHKIIKRTNGK